MSFDGLITKQVVAELNDVLIGGKINKVFEPNKNEIILGVYCCGKNYALDISISSNNYRMNLTTISKPNPLNAPNFCMLLRKHLIGSRIVTIESHSLERIITIGLECYNELNDIVHKKLIVELMGKHSNIILVNEKNIIIDSMRHLDSSGNSFRDIMPAREYINPPNNKKDFSKILYDEFEQDILANSDSISNYVCTTYTGFSKAFLTYTLNKLDISNTTKSKNDIKALYDYLNSLITSIGADNIFATLLENDYCLDFGNSKDFNLNFFLDDFYKQKEDDEILINYKNNLSKLVLSALKKITKKVNNINMKLKECEQIDTYKIYGELITANLYRINNSINLESITLDNYYDNNKPVTIPLDKTISPAQNAKKFFKKYNKLKNTLNVVSSQKEDASNELNYLESIIYELDNADSISNLEDIDNEISENVLFKNSNINTSKNSNIKKNKINKRKTHDEYEPITYNIDGFTLYVGKNNKQNDYITTKLGKNEDLWFHTKDIRGSHCLLKCNGNKVSQNTIVACCEIAAFYSKAKLSKNVPVDYCFVRNVKKPSNSKPGMVIYANNQTVNVNPKKLKE